MSATGLDATAQKNPDAAFTGGSDTAEKTIYFDKGSKKFWFQSVHGEWIGYDKAFAQCFIKKFKNKSGGCDSDKKLSELDDELLRVAMEDYVSYAGPLAGWKKGFYKTGGDRLLVTRSPSMIEPVAGDWSTLDKIFSAVLGGYDAPPNNEHAVLIDQRDFFFAWWRYALLCLRECMPERGLAMVLAGEAGCGKTLIKQLVNASFGGREVYPYAFMIGRDNFNAEMLEAELWTVDDETADTSIQARIKFGAEIKKITANSSMRFRGMMREAVTLNTFKRLFICVNREPDRLMVLPPMDDDVRGKIALLLAYNSNLFEQIEKNSPIEKKTLDAAITEELPHFLHYLLFEWQPCEALNGRFGSREFHHPELTEELFTLSPAQIILDQVARVLKQVFAEQPLMDEWIGTAAELRELMCLEDGPLSHAEIKKLPAYTWIGKNLKKLSVQMPWKFRHIVTKENKKWGIKK